jgi:hypothetical protein
MGATSNIRRICYCYKKCESDLTEEFDFPEENKNAISLQEFENEIPLEIYKKMIKETFPDYIQTDNKMITEKRKIDNKKDVIMYYNGEYDEKLRAKSGRGKLILVKNEEKVFYNGIWENDNLNKGTIYYLNGDIYKGEMKDYLRNGKGKFISNSETYEGDWEEDQKNGEGTLIFKNGLKYKGKFKNNQFNGKGKIESSDGFYYSGTFLNNQMDGKGFLRGSNGHIYNGDFKNGLFHGEGEFKWIDQSNVEIYKGSYSFGKKDGIGTFTFSNGNVYEGEWKSGNPDGIGIFETQNRKYKGNWRSGLFMQLIEANDKYESQEENVNFNFKVPLEDILLNDHISTSLNSEIKNSSLSEYNIEVIKLKEN